MRRREKNTKPPKPYKSWLEHDLHQGPLINCSYEPTTLKYAVPAEYTPDFVSPDGMTWYEAKGYIRDYNELKKYLWVREVLNGVGKELIFVLAGPTKRAYPQCRRRRDGTYLSLAGWCEINGFKWTTPERLGREGI